MRNAHKVRRSRLQHEPSDYAILQISRLKFCTVWFIIVIMIHFELFSYWPAKLVHFSHTETKIVPSPRVRMRVRWNVVHNVWTHTDFREVIESDGFCVRFARYFRFHFSSAGNHASAFTFGVLLISIMISFVHISLGFARRWCKQKLKSFLLRKSLFLF